MMNYGEIHVKHIYYVDFEPTLKSEFNGKHLACVIKKNNDNETAIVLPLTTKQNGLGRGKIELGVLACLPKMLQGQSTFATVNQIRTVNKERFSSVQENYKDVSVEIDDDSFKKTLYAIMNDLMYAVDKEIKSEVLRDAHLDLSVKRVNILLHEILTEKNKEIIAKKKNEIIDLLKYIPYRHLYKRIDARVKPLLLQLFIKIFFTNILKNRY